MQYMNITIATCRSPQYLSATPSQRGAWTSLMAYCCGQENGGAIAGCRSWSDSMWQQSVCVPLDIVNEHCALWHFEGENCIVFAYPKEQEENTQILRKRGKAAIKKRWSSSVKIPHGMPNGNRAGNTKDKLREDKLSNSDPIPASRNSLKTGLMYPLPPPEKTAS